jgi:hypothetical protein
MLIAEMLLLVAVNDKGHVSPWSGGSFLNVGLTGALLAELAMGGQLTIADDGTVRAGPTRPDDELLADVYDAVLEHLDGRKTQQVIRGLSRHIGGSQNRVIDRLADTGVLGPSPPPDHGQRPSFRAGAALSVLLSSVHWRRSRSRSVLPQAGGSTTVPGAWLATHPDRDNQDGDRPKYQARTSAAGGG